MASDNWYVTQRAKNPVGIWARRASDGAKERSKKHAVPFNLTYRLLMSLAPERCPVLGITLDYSGGVPGSRGGKDNSASVDRIIPEDGYVPGNIRVVSLKANQIKSNATPEEILRVGRFYYALQLHNSGETYGRRRIRCRGRQPTIGCHEITLSPNREC